MKRTRGFRSLTDRLLFGRREKGITLQKQMSRIIVICCVIAVVAQAVLMTGVIISFYVRREVKDTEFLLRSANDSMNNTVQFLKDRIPDIQRNNGLEDFFASGAYDAEQTKEQLRISANLFSERNRQGYQTPFITEVWLFNHADACVCDLYYPKTVREQGERRAVMYEIYRRFLQQGGSFYSEPAGEDVALGMHLYSETMEEIGSCLVVMSRAHVEEVYRPVEALGDYVWSIRMDGRELLGRDTAGKSPVAMYENTRQTGFNLTLLAAVSKHVVYRSLGLTIALLIVLSGIIIAAAAVAGSLIARRYVRPLETVAEKIKQVGHGAFDTKLGDYEAEELHQISMTFNDMTAYINQLINQVYETELLSRNAQIRYLQAQMNPHFLFNVLSMIELKAAANGDAEVQQKISMLSRLLQGRIFRKGEIEIPLSEEMEIVEFYLNLQNSRFGNKITYAVHYDRCKTDPHNLMVPRLSIEPIVENAVAHGLEPKEGDGHIDVTVLTDEILQVIIEDNGVGFDTESVGEQKTDGEHSGVGLMNTDKMIRRLYGDDYGIRIESRIGEGSKITARLPRIERRESAGVDAPDEEEGQ